MTLRKKILAIIAILFLFIAGFLFWITDRIVMRSFLRLEIRNAEKNVIRAENALEGELDNLHAIGGDWGGWNETQEFLLNSNDDYINNNLEESTLGNLRLDFIVFLNQQGNIVYGKAIDLITRKYDQSPESLHNHILAHPDLLLHKHPKDGKKGVILLPEGPTLIIAWPITNSRYEAPIHGTLIMGRYLTPVEIDSLMRKTELSIRILEDNANPPTAEWKQVNAQLSKTAPIAIHAIDHDRIAGYKRIHDIHGKPCLLLKVDMTRDIITQGRESIRYFMLAILSAGVLMVLFLYILLQKIVINPITGLKKQILSIKETNPLSGRPQFRHSDEIGILTSEFNQMMTQLKQKSAELTNSNLALQMDVGKRKEAEEELRRMNQALQRSLSDLKETQDQLIQSEKMASLGGLVAGVAHEINTPLGVAITAASLLQDRTRDLNETCQSLGIESLDLFKFVKLTTEASHLVLTNLKRVAELVNSFKQVSVDQFSEHRRWFRVKKYIDQLLFTMEPKAQRSRHSVTVECPDDMEIDSFPGVFAQVLTNLVMNSLMHGFEFMDTGKIEIIIRRETDSLVLIYTDNGKGMDKETLDRMFDPFFTTKRGRGGTGLGMNILYNLVTRSLKGKLECTSTPGEGVFFLIRIPLDENRIRYI